MVGLGNPGTSYAATRHNLGFRVVERVATRAGVAWHSAPVAGHGLSIAEAAVRGAEFLLVRPLTFMNHSGPAVRVLLEQRGAPPHALVLVHDDGDLELGRIRIRRGGGDGGHNGVRSVHDAVGTRDFARIRLGVRGVGRPGGQLVEYVLGVFEPAEAKLAEQLIERGADAVVAVVVDGLAQAMNRFNGRGSTPEAV